MRPLLAFVVPLLLLVAIAPAGAQAHPRQKAPKVGLRKVPRHETSFVVDDTALNVR